MYSRGHFLLVGGERPLDLVDPLEVQLEQPIDEAKAVAETLPHRRKYLLLAYDLVDRLFELHLEWVDEVERALAADEEEVSA